MFKKNSQPKPKYRIKNWSEYNKALKQRGSLTLWFEEGLEAHWLNQTLTGNKGASEKYTDLAITTFLRVKALYRLALRATEGFLGSLFQMLGLNLSVPEYSTVSRRRQRLDIDLSHVPSGNAIHMVVDSTGVKIFGEGEWKVRQHGWQKRRTWRKLHLGFDETSHEIVAAVVTSNDVADGEVLPDLLEQVSEPIDQVSGDKGYDWHSCHEVIEKRKARAVIPLRKNAKIKQRKQADIKPLSRDETLRAIRKEGKQRWKKLSNYHRRSLAETGIFRVKRIFGGQLLSVHFESQATDLFIRCELLNKMTRLGMPNTVAVIEA